MFKAMFGYNHSKIYFLALCISKGNIDTYEPEDDTAIILKETSRNLSTLQNLPTCCGDENCHFYVCMLV